MIREKKLITTIIILNIVLIIGTMTISFVMDSFTEKSDKSQELYRLEKEQLESEIREYKKLAKELFNFQLVAMAKECGSKKVVKDLYGNAIDTMDISKIEIEKIISEEFLGELKTAITKAEEYTKRFVYSKFASKTTVGEVLMELDEINKLLLSDEYGKALKYIKGNDIAYKMVDSEVVDTIKSKELYGIVSGLSNK